MSLVKEVVYAWQLVFRQAQMQRSREISLCFFISQAWKKLLHRIYFRRRMKYKQKMFLLRNFQDQTRIVKRRFISKLWKSFIDQYLIRTFFNFWTKHYETVHGLTQTEMKQQFYNQFKWKAIRKSFFSWNVLVTQKCQRNHTLFVYKDMNKLRLVDKSF